MDAELKALVEERQTNYLDQKYIDVAIIERVIEIYDEEQTMWKTMSDHVGFDVKKLLYGAIDND